MSITSPHFPCEEFVRRNHRHLVEQLRANGRKTAAMLAGFIDREDILRRHMQAFHELDCVTSTEPRLDIYCQGDADNPQEEMIASLVYDVNKRPQKSVAFLFKLRDGSCSAVCQERFVQDLGKSSKSSKVAASAIEKIDAADGMSPLKVLKFVYPCF